MKELVFVTHNVHKSEEVNAIIGNHFEIKNLSDLNIFEDIPETGSTFKENALQKAEYVYKKLYTFINIFCIIKLRGVLICIN